MDEQTQLFYEFGEYRIERGDRLLRCGDKVVSLPPKAVELLFVLLDSGGRVLTKDELMSLVWPESFVEEANLSQNIFLLRKALDTGKNGGGKFIATVPRRGYRFVADVRVGGDVFISRERTVTQIVVDEEIETSVEPVLKPVRVSNARSKTDPALKISLVAATAVCVLVALGGGLFFRSQKSHAGAESGEATPLMKVLPLTSFPNDELDSALSPDGKEVAFSWPGNEGGRGFEIYVKLVDAGTPLRLTRTVLDGRSGAPAWSPDGRYIAFLRQTDDPGENGIYVVPALGGVERKMYSVADADLLGAGLDWSPDGKMLVFSSRRVKSEPFALVLLDLQTLGTRQLTEPPAQSEGDFRPDFSPDNQQIAFTRAGQDILELYMSDLNGVTRRLTFDNLKVIGAAWKPDGKSIVFSSNRGGSSSLWQIKPDDQSYAPEALHIGVENALDPSISRTGNRLTFTQRYIDANIWRIDLANTEHIESTAQLTSSSRREMTPNVSHDAKRIAYSSEASGHYEIWTCDGSGSNPAQLTYFGGPFTTNPRFSGDGKQILVDSRPEGNADVFIINAEGGSARKLTSGGSNNIAPRWSNDGQFIYFASDRNGTWQVWRMTANGEEPTQITRNDGFEATESADGQTLYYSKYNATGIFEMSLVRPDDQEKMVTDLKHFHSFGNWALAPGGIYFVDRDADEIKYFNFTTRQTNTAVKGIKVTGENFGLNFIGDQNSLVFSKEDYRNHDIVLVENFR